jgi:hypothetical protein
MGVRPLALFLASELLLQAVCLLESAALVGPSPILGLLPTSSVLGLSPLPSLGRLASLGVTPQIKHPSCLIRGWKPAARGHPFLGAARVPGLHVRSRAISHPAESEGILESAAI